MAHNPAEATSLKQLLQGIQVKDMTLLQGKVIQESPLKIQAVNDEKLVITEEIAIVPRHLSNYTATCDVWLGSSGTIDSITQTDGEHSHSGGTHEGHASGDGSHTHSGDGTHAHSQKTFNIETANITIYNALKAGEMVHLLAFDNGKKYYILDRVVN